MKNKIFSKIAKTTAALFILCLMSYTVKAQPPCPPYTVDNKTSCPIIVDINVYCNGVLCSSSAGVSIPAVNFVNAPACNCAGGCRVEVIVTDINGNTGAPLPITVNSINPGPYSWPTAWCNAPYYQVLWTSTRTLIQ